MHQTGLALAPMPFRENGAVDGDANGDAGSNVGGAGM